MTYDEPFMDDVRSNAMAPCAGFVFDGGVRGRCVPHGYRTVCSSCSARVALSVTRSLLRTRRQRRVAHHLEGVTSALAHVGRTLEAAREKNHSTLEASPSRGAW